MNAEEKLLAKIKADKEKRLAKAKASKEKKLAKSAAVKEKRLVKIRDSKIDGLGPKDIENIRKAVRQVWHWSHAKKLVIARTLGKDGFGYCEKCKRKSPKIYVDHIKKVGDVDSDFIERLFTPSINLQGLCKKCHDDKTKEERISDKEAVVPDFF